MRVVEVEEWGIDGLRVSHREAQAPGSGQLRVRLTASSLNYRDLLMVQGKYNPRQPLPLIPGSDGAGVVEAVGDDVTEFSVGDRVIATFFEDWNDGQPTTAELRTSRGGPIDGCMREVMVAPASSFVRTPDHLSDIEAATLPCAALTAWSALVSQGGVKPGDSVLVLGTGGVSMFAIQFAKMAGAHVIATSSSDDKLEVLRTDFGVESLLNYRHEPNWGKAVRSMTGEGVDHVIEVGGVGTMSQSLRAVRPGGTISLIGVLAEPDPRLDLTSALMRNVRIQGVIVGNRTQFEEMNRAIAHHEMRPLVDRTFDLDEVADAFSYLESARHMGKVVITM